MLWSHSARLICVLAGALLISSCAPRRADDLAPLRGTARAHPGGDGGVWLEERLHAKAPDEVLGMQIGSMSDPDWKGPKIAFGPTPIKRPERYKVRSGDVLVIDVLGEENMRQEVKVGPDGRIDYYIAHGVMASGKTFPEIRGEITKKLRAHFKKPQISVSGHSFAGNTVSVLGVFAKPGRYEIRSDTRLLDVIADAGGIPLSWRWTGGGRTGAEDVADLERAYVLRGSKFLDVNFAHLMKGTKTQIVKNNVLLKPDDRIYLPPSIGSDQRIIVLGEVRRPGVLRFSKKITFLEAIAEAGGVKPSARERRSFVVRGRLSKPTIIPINSRRVMVGRARDVQLKAGDIVFVPKSALGKFDEVARQIIPLLDSINRSEDIGR